MIVNWWRLKSPIFGLNNFAIEQDPTSRTSNANRCAAINRRDCIILLQIISLLDLLVNEAYALHLSRFFHVLFFNQNASVQV
jgi:hypothetical protein